MFSFEAGQSHVPGSTSWEKGRLHLSQLVARSKCKVFGSVPPSSSSAPSVLRQRLFENPETMGPFMDVSWQGAPFLDLSGKGGVLFTISVKKKTLFSGFSVSFKKTGSLF